MKKTIIILRIAGVLCLLLTIFHTFFHKMFNWPESLNCLDLNNRSIFLTYHYIGILILSFMTFVSLFQPKELLKSSLKYSVLGLFSLFYLIRIIAEFTLFGLDNSSLVILPLCAILMGSYLYPMFAKVKIEN